MPEHKIARKALVEGRMIILAGVIFISIFALVRMAGFPWGGISSSRQAQAELMANMIAISANALSGIDAGSVSEDFTLSQDSQPMTIQVYDKGEGAMYVKVTYDDKGNYYEAPLLVRMDPIAPIKANRITVMKDITGNVTIQEAAAGQFPKADVPCSQPTKEKIAEYVSNAVNNLQVNKYRNVDAAFVMGVIGAESRGFQCVNGYLNVNKDSGAAGLMQLMPDTAAGINSDFKFQPVLNYEVSEDNVKLGTAYLSALLKQFGGDRDKAVAAYNCGPTRIACLAEKYGSNWQSHLNEPCNHNRACGSETANYIVKVNTCMMACNQKACGIC